MTFSVYLNEEEYMIHQVNNKIDYEVVISPMNNGELNICWLDTSFNMLHFHIEKFERNEEKLHMGYDNEDLMRELKGLKVKFDRINFNTQI